MMRFPIGDILGQAGMLQLFDAGATPGRSEVPNLYPPPVHDDRALPAGVVQGVPTLQLADELEVGYETLLRWRHRI